MIDWKEIVFVDVCVVCVSDGAKHYTTQGLPVVSSVGEEIASGLNVASGIAVGLGVTVNVGVGVGVAVGVGRGVGVGVGVFVGLGVGVLVGVGFAVGVGEFSNGVRLGLAEGEDEDEGDGYSGPFCSFVVLAPSTLFWFEGLVSKKFNVGVGDRVCEPLTLDLEAKKNNPPIIATIKRTDKTADTFSAEKEKENSFINSFPEDLVSIFSL